MDLRKLRHAVTLSRVLNFTKAAEELGITQPVLSRSIQSLESEAKVRFFDRDKASVHVTPAGQTFVQRAAGILAEMDELEASLRKVADGKAGHLSFGMGRLPAGALLADILPPRIRETPELGYNIPVRNPRALLRLLEAEAIEFFISAEAFVPEPSNIRGSFVGYFPLGPLVRAGHPLLNPLTPTGERYRLLTTARTDELAQVPLSLRPRLVQSQTAIVENDAALAEITANTDAVWITSPFVVQKELESGRLVELPLSPDETPSRLRMMEYRLDRRTLSPVAVAMRERIRGKIQALWHQREKAGG